MPYDTGAARQARLTKPGVGPKHGRQLEGGNLNAAAAATQFRTGQYRPNTWAGYCHLEAEACS
jgi:hypothetical protein